MRFLAIVGGTNAPSNADVLCDAFLEGVIAACPDAIVTKLRAKDLKIQHFSLANYAPHCTTEDDFCALQEHVLAADALVFATPIWNFSIPGHLKNIVDRMGAFCLDEQTRSKGQLKGTPTFFLFTGGAPTPVWKGLMRFTTHHLPEALRYYGAQIIGRHYEGRCTVGRGTFGLVINQRPDALMRARAKGRFFGTIAQEYKVRKILPLRFRVIGALYRLGQRIIGKLW